jgi:hypothetical protein
MILIKIIGAIIALYCWAFEFDFSFSQRQTNMNCKNILEYTDEENI